jgi:ubiquinone/menaquinone biosynthesis C-methylase UbiE
MSTLKEIYSKYSTPEGKGDKGTIHSYMDLYQEHIVKKDQTSLFEIGICEGHSLAMWKEFLEDGEVWGIDIDTSAIKFNLSNCTLIQGDATNEVIVSFLEDKRFDYIIDDGSHLINHQIKSFQLLFQFLKEDGKYFIEDITSKNAEVLKVFLDSQKVKYECYDFVEKSGRDDDIIFLIYKNS